MAGVNSALHRLHHVGYVVRSIASTAPAFADSMGAEWNGVIFDDPIQRVKVTFLTPGHGDAQLELVEPNGEDAPVSRFLQQRGEALHHLCYEVSNIENAISIMRAKGSLLTKPPRPAVAFAGRRIAWLLTREKLLVELLEEGPRQI